jgi:ribosomal protein S18 acetylase RimI-like enzyme
MGKERSKMELKYKLEGFLPEELDSVYKLFNKFSKEVGFVMKPSIIESARRRNLIVVKDGDKVIGSCKFNIRKRDKVGVIYEVVVDNEYRGKGIGLECINIVRGKCLYLELKCPVDNESNKFYEKVGFKKVGVIKGKKRELNVWRILGR